VEADISANTIGLEVNAKIAVAVKSVNTTDVDTNANHVAGLVFANIVNKNTCVKIAEERAFANMVNAKFGVKIAEVAIRFVNTTDEKPIVRIVIQIIAAMNVIYRCRQVGRYHITVKQPDIKKHVKNCSWKISEQSC